MLTDGALFLTDRQSSYRDAFVNDFNHGQVLCENASSKFHGKPQHNSETHAQNDAELQGEEDNYHEPSLSRRKRNRHELVNATENYLQHTRCRSNHLLFIIFGKRTCKHSLQSVMDNSSVGNPVSILQFSLRTSLHNTGKVPVLPRPIHRREET